MQVVLGSVEHGQQALFQLVPYATGIRKRNDDRTSGKMGGRTSGKRFCNKSPPITAINTVDHSTEMKNPMDLPTNRLPATAIH